MTNDQEETSAYFNLRLDLNFAVSHLCQTQNNVNLQDLAINFQKSLYLQSLTCTGNT